MIGDDYLQSGNMTTTKWLDLGLQLVGQQSMHQVYAH